MGDSSASAYVQYAYECVWCVFVYMHAFVFVFMYIYVCVLMYV